MEECQNIGVPRLRRSSQLRWIPLAVIRRKVVYHPAFGGFFRFPFDESPQPKKNSCPDMSIYGLGRGQKDWQFSGRFVIGPDWGVRSRNVSRMDESQPSSRAHSPAITGGNNKDTLSHSPPNQSTVLYETESWPFPWPFLELCSAGPVRPNQV